ncbi:hypothetical protein J6590_107913, partial [Homalodisca vitripennis]
RFLRLIGVRLGFAYLDVPVEDLSSNLNLSPLALRRDVADVVLLWKIVNGRMNCPDLLAEIDLRVPANTRSRDLLGRRYHSTNFDFNSPFARFIRLGNQVASGCDLFFDGLHQAAKKFFNSTLTTYQNERTHTNEGLLNSPELHQLIDIHIPQKTRLTQTFSRHHYHTVYAYHSTVPRLMRLRNGSQLEFFGMTHQTFRRQALSLPSESNQFTF